MEPGEEVLVDLRYPRELTPELKEVLRLMVFDTGPLARAYRDAGFDVPRKVEEEQAFILHKLTLLVLEYGPDWREAFKKVLAPVLEKARQNLEAALAQKTQGLGR